MSHHEAMRLLIAEREAKLKPAIFKADDKVTFTNDAGGTFKGKTVLSQEVIDGENRYHITPTDTPWYPAHERNLSPA